MRSCSALCAAGYPSAGLERSGRETSDSAVVSGMNQSVVLTLIEMGFTHRGGFETAIDIDSAFALLDEPPVPAKTAGRRRGVLG